METQNQKIAKALMVLTPNAEWVLRGDDYADIQWLSTDITKPSLEEITAEINNPTQPTIVDKLASVGLSLEELKAALGGN